MPRRPPAVARVLERVTKTVREHEMFGPGDLVLVACSGGPDSVCLLYSLWHLRRLFKIRLAVFHFDHKLRPDSAKDAAYVRNLAERLMLPVYLRTAEDGPSKGVSVEAWATVARMSAANDVRREIGGKRNRGGAHPRRSGRDGLAQPDPWLRSRGDRGDRSWPPEPRARATSLRCRTSRCGGVLPGDPSQASARSDERGSPLSTGRDPARGHAGLGARDGPRRHPVDREDGRPASWRPR